MIDEIQVENVALIREATLEPAPGLTVLTGETGAGKTALLSALKLLMGERADKSAVRDGEGALSVSGRFFLTASHEIGEADGFDEAGGFDEADESGELGEADGLGEAGDAGATNGSAEAGEAKARQAGDAEPATKDAEFVVTRRVSSDGRSRVNINGHMASVTQLAETIAPTVDLCGQHEHQQLMKPASHLRILDSWAAETINQPLQAYQVAFAEAQAAAKELARVLAAGQESSAKLDEARFILKRIDEVQPRPDEYEELMASLSKAEHAEALALATNTAAELLSGDDGATDLLARAINELDGVADFDEQLKACAESLREAGYILEDVARETRIYCDGIDFDGESLAADQERMSLLQGLLRTYGPRMEDVIATRDQAAELISLVDDAAERENAARKAQAQAEEALAAAAHELADARRKAAPQFARAVCDQLARLEKGGAKLTCEIADLPRDQWTKHGSVAVEFLFQPGKGMQARPLVRIASGGEVSRVMLAIKVVLGQADHVDTLVFDEVDAGVGGSTAVALADVLADLALTHQVIVVTHLAQVAVRGDIHYVVEKVSAKNGIPETKLRALSSDDRPAEIARMLSGEVTDASLAHAREMLGE
ncbi:DNA repair protein RecN [Eggerthellaceae bacterium 3-80]|nr:DNA repair protein RecN [bacterium D16-34]